MSGMTGKVQTDGLTSLAATFRQQASAQRSANNHFASARTAMDSTGDAKSINTYENGTSGNGGFNAVAKFLDQLAQTYDGAAQFLAQHAAPAYSGSENANGGIAGGTNSGGSSGGSSSGPSGGNGLY